jgi:hypothetical protein
MASGDKNMNRTRVSERKDLSKTCSKFRSRAGNIEFLYSSINRTFEVVQHYPNQYYGRKDEMVKNEGWTLEEDGSVTKDHVTISASCFDGPESGCVIMFVEFNLRDRYFDFETVGTRPFDIDDTEMADLKMVIEYISKNVEKICEAIMEGEEETK